MKKIVIDARIINSSTGRYVLRLLQNLEKIDSENEYTVLVPTKDLQFWQPTAKNFRVRAVDFANYSFAEQFGFKKFLDSLSADLVHFCMPQQPIMYRGKHVTTVHDLTLFYTYNSDKNWLLYHAKQFVGRFVFKSVGKRSDHVLTPSNFTKTEFAKFAKINPEKITVTYEAADPADTNIEKCEIPFQDYLLYVGQQSDYKNLRRLIDAHQILLKKYPDLGLVFVGRINDATQKNIGYAEKIGAKNVHFTGFLPDEQRNYLYKNCRAYIFPSLLEGFGLPGLEAMANGAPVVSSNATCLPEVYGEAAYYFDPTDVRDIATKIDGVLINEKLRKKLVANGAKKVREYSWQRCAEQTLEVYQNALRK